MSLEDINLKKVTDKTDKQTRRRLLDQEFSEKVKQELERAEEEVVEHGPAEVDPNYVTPTEILDDTQAEQPKAKRWAERR